MKTIYSDYLKLIHCCVKVNKTKYRNFVFKINTIYTLYQKFYIKLRGRLKSDIAPFWKPLILNDKVVMYEQFSPTNGRYRQFWETLLYIILLKLVLEFAMFDY